MRSTQIKPHIVYLSNKGLIKGSFTADDLITSYKGNGYLILFTIWMDEDERIPISLVLIRKLHKAIAFTIIPAMERKFVPY